MTINCLIVASNKLWCVDHAPDVFKLPLNVLLLLLLECPDLIELLLLLIVGDKWHSLSLSHPV